MKKKCTLCSKSKLKAIEIDSKIVCNLCIKNDNKLEQLLKGYFASNQNTVSKSLEQNGDAISYHQVLKKEDKSFKELFNYLDKLTEETQEKNIKKNKIISKLSEMNEQSNKKFLSEDSKKNILNKLTDFSLAELKECEQTLVGSDNIQEFSENSEIKTIKHNLEVPDPKELFNLISEQVIDQSDAVKAISMALTKHMCRLKDTKIRKNNIMIIGPTGTGKTELVKIFAKHCEDIPVLMLDSSSFTAIGYKGASVDETIAAGLLSLTKGNLVQAGKSIVFLDEIDKKAAIHSQNASDIGTIQVQQQLLKIIEGGELRTQIANSQGNMVNVTIDTSNILFICAGAFSGLEKIINKNSIKKVSLTDGPSLVKELENSFKNATNKHLEQYGLIPEFLGRFGTITYTKPLTKDSLVKILNKPEDSLVENYKKLFFQYQCNLLFTVDFLEEIAEEAAAQGIGARGLERIFEVKMQPYFFNIVSYIGKVLTIDVNGKHTVGKKIKLINN